MTLQFQPPPEWLVNEYVNRKQPAEIANEGIQGAIHGYLTMKQQQQAQQLAQEGKDIDLARLSTQGGTNAIDTLNAIRRARNQPPLTVSEPGIMASQVGIGGTAGIMPNQKSSMSPAMSMTPTAAEDLAQQSLPSEHQISPLIQASIEAGHGNPLGLPTSGVTTPPTGKPVPPTLGSDPAIEEFNLLGSQKYERKYGSGGLEKVKTALAIQKGLQDKNASKTPTSLEQILAREVADGRMTLDEALRKKAEGVGMTTEATTTTKNRVNLEKERPKAQASLTNTLREYDNMINEAQSISNDPSIGSATGLTSGLSSIPGTGAKRVAARLETLKAKTLLNVLASLKELSTNGSSGFGQLSNTEGENLRNSISSLDRTQSTKDFKDSLDRFITEMKHRKGVLSDTFNSTYGGGGNPPAYTPPSDNTSGGGGWSYVGKVGQ